MPVLRATNVYLTITWLGVVTHRRDIEIETEPRKRLDLDWDGVTGAAHLGRTLASDGRVYNSIRVARRSSMFGS